MSKEPGNIEFESKSHQRLREARERRKSSIREEDFSAEPSEREVAGPAQSAIDGRQTDTLLDFERTQQPVTGHQDRRHK